ncbi:MAG: hypothetical protein JSS68_15120 [Actinobacteria bacterium]|nr:hypothetical protein [Actinomycetota bacterium]
MILIYSDGMTRARMFFAVMMVAGALAFLILATNPTTSTTPHIGLSNNVAVEHSHHGHRHPKAVGHAPVQVASSPVTHTVAVTEPVSTESPHKAETEPQGGSQPVSVHHEKTSPHAAPTKSEPTPTTTESSPPVSSPTAEAVATVTTEPESSPATTPDQPEHPLASTVENVVSTTTGAVHGVVGDILK